MADLDDLLATHGRLTDDLAAAIRGLGETQKKITETRASVWHQTGGLGVTERREEITAACSEWQALADEDRAEVDALRAEVAHAALAVQVALDG